MKLILKLPANKPPFIGVLLSPGDNRSYPEKLHEELLLHHKYAGYCLELELKKTQLQLHLKAEQSGILKHYNDLSYEADHLLYWMYTARNSPACNFGHVMLNGTKENILRTWSNKQPFVLPLTGCPVILPVSSFTR